MSGYYMNSGSDEERELESGGSGSGLRKQLEDLLAENKRLSKLLEGDRQKVATDLLKEKGLDPAVLELAGKDVDPVEWVEKYAPLLGAKTTEPEVKIPEPQVTAPDPENEDEAVRIERESRAAMADAQATGSQASVVSTDLMEKLDKFGPDATEDQLLQFFRQNGMA